MEGAPVAEYTVANGNMFAEMGAVTEKNGVCYPDDPDGIDANKLLAQITEQMNEIQQELSQLIEKQPEDVASLLRGWLVER